MVVILLEGPDAKQRLRSHRHQRFWSDRDMSRPLLGLTWLA